MNKITKEEKLAIEKFDRILSKSEIEECFWFSVDELRSFLVDSLRLQRKELIKKQIEIINKWFKEFMVDKSVRTDVKGITCLEELKNLIKEDE